MVGGDLTGLQKIKKGDEYYYRIVSISYLVPAERLELQTL